MGRKILGTTKSEEQQKRELKYDEKNLKKAQKYADDFFKSEENLKHIAPFLLGNKIRAWVEKNGDKSLAREIEYLVFKKWSE